MSSPMIIVVEGRSSQSAGSEVAAELANYLKYSLINPVPDDVAPTLQGYLTSSSNQAPSAISQDLDSVSFKNVYQTASTKLRSKLGVVVYLPLSNLARFEQLKLLANSQGVELLLVQCRPQEEIVDEDAGGVRKLTVDTNKHFDVESFISAHFGQTFAQSSEETYRHLHCLVLHDHAARLRCKGCGDLISGPNYQCSVCGEYIFHKSCAELPEDLQKIRDNCPPSLDSTDPYFSKKQRCKICEKNHKSFSDGCHDCLLESSIRGKFLPVVVNHEAHSHPPNLIIMPNPIIMSTDVAAAVILANL